MQYEPQAQLRLDRPIVVDVLRGARQGLSASLSGIRSEHLRTCLGNPEATELLAQAAEKLAQGRVP